MNNIFLNFVKAQLIMKLVGRRGEESVSSQTKQRRERGESSLAEQEESHAQQSFVNMGEMESEDQRSSYHHYSANHQHHGERGEWRGTRRGEVGTNTSGEIRQIFTNKTGKIQSRM